MSRVENIAKNVKFALICQAALVLVQFLVRKVFALTLGEEYLGLNGLFSNILSMLSFAELGVGTSIIYSLYKPIAEHDTEKIKSLMRLYKRAYLAIGIFILAAGISLTPHLDFFVKEMPSDIPHIEWIYVLNVANSGISYFFIYKASLLFADQKRYVETIVTTITKLTASLFQLAVLWKTGDYLLYLLITAGATLLQNFWICAKTDRMYPYLKEKQVQRLPKEDLHVIKKNVGAMMFHKLGQVVVFSTDSILMAKFVSVVSVGIYSNYLLIRKSLQMVIELVFVSLAASMGHVNASETDEKKYEVFCNVNFLSAWVFGFMSICLLLLYNPFIRLWLGEEYLFPFSTVAVIVANFYMYCMRMPIGNMKDAMGLFWNDRYKPLAEVALNFGISVVLGKHYGIFGILLGTLISTILVPFWVEPLVLYLHGFERNPWIYFRQYAGYLTVTVLAGMVTGAVCSMTGAGMAGFVMKMFLCGTVPNLVYLLVYGRTPGFRYIKATITGLLSNRFRYRR